MMPDDLVELMTYSSGVEAEVVVAILGGFGIPAQARGNDIVGIFGPNFMGSTARGVAVVVPRDSLDEARRILAGSDAMDQ